MTTWFTNTLLIWVWNTVTTWVDKGGVDGDELANFRQTSNISRTAISYPKDWRLSASTSCWTGKGFLSAVQPGYRRHHLTETAITIVVSDIVTAGDNRDVSNAIRFIRCFWYVNQSIMFHRLLVSHNIIGSFSIHLVRKLLTSKGIWQYFTVKRPLHISV